MLRTYRLLYRVNLTPWRSATPPQALTTVVAGLTPGIAVDLGCGTGEQARHLAALGWRVTAVDAVPAALDLARRADRDGRVTWRLADVTDLGAVDPAADLAGTATLVLDNGCLHGIVPGDRPGWAATVRALAAPGAVLLVRAAAPAGRLSPLRGIARDGIADLIGTGWQRRASPGPGWHHFTRGG